MHQACAGTPEPAMGCHTDSPHGTRDQNSSGIPMGKNTTCGTSFWREAPAESQSSSQLAVRLKARKRKVKYTKPVSNGWPVLQSGSDLMGTEIGTSLCRVMYSLKSRSRLIGRSVEDSPAVDHPERQRPVSQCVGFQSEKSHPAIKHCVTVDHPARILDITSV
jgi:hypothetical protein